MELRHIRYFLAVAECLNFREAAQFLHIAQPPLSRQIRQLEEYLGVALFIRNKRHVELTKAGHVFHEEARKLIAQAAHTAEAARHAQKGETGVIKIGIASGLGGIVNRMVSAFRKRSSSVEVECRDVFSNFQSDALRKLEIDVGFLRPPLDHINLDCELLYQEEFVVILPKTHRLARRRSLRLREIAEEPLVLFDRNFSNGLYDKIVALYSRQGFTPRLLPTHVEAHEEAGAITVASGKAIFLGAGAIVNRSVAGIDLVSVRLREPDAMIEVYVAWRKGEDSPSVKTFLNCVRNVMASRVKSSLHSTI